MSNEQYIAGMQERENAFQNKLKQSGKPADPTRKAPNMVPLSAGQKRHSIRFFQTFLEAKTVFESFSNVKNVFIQHGRLVLTYKLKQLCRMRLNVLDKKGVARSVPVNVVFHNFDGKEWSALKDYNTDSEYTIHVFHSSASPDFMNDKSVVQIDCFRPNVHFDIPSYFQEVLTMDMDSKDNQNYVKRLLMLYPVMVAINFLKKHGGGNVVIDDVYNFGDKLQKVFQGEFPDMIKCDFPKKRLAVEQTDAVAVVEQVELQTEEAPKVKAKAKAEPKGKKQPVREPLEDILPETPKKKPQPKAAGKADGAAASTDKLKQLQSKFKGATA